MDPIITASLVGTAMLVGAVAYRPLKRWGRKVRRRKGGVYGYRVRKHGHPFRRHWGYIGETVNFYLRDRQHMGRGRFTAAGAVVTKKTSSAPSQPWSDLDPVRYEIIKLPWWLCWKWVLRPLETLVMLVTWPVYNDAKNGWNPRRVTKDRAKAERAQRDGMPFYARTVVTVVSWSRRLTVAAGVLVTLVGLTGWMVTR